MLILDKNHIYHNNGVVIPGVTEILKSLNMIDDSFYDTEGADRGTKVHLACQYYDEGVLLEDTLDPVIVPYLVAWKRFRSEQCPQDFDLIEEKLMTSYGFAGTVDRFCRPIIVDIKTGIPSYWAGLQLAGYQILIESWMIDNEMPEPGPLKRCVVKLNNDGTYKLYWYNNKHDKNLFLSCVSLYHYKNNGGK